MSSSLYVQPVHPAQLEPSQVVFDVQAECAAPSPANSSTDTTCASEQNDATVASQADENTAGNDANAPLRWSHVAAVFLRHILTTCGASAILFLVYLAFSGDWLEFMVNDDCGEAKSRWANWLGDRLCRFWWTSCPLADVHCVIAVWIVLIPAGLSIPLAMLAIVAVLMAVLMAVWVLTLLARLLLLVGIPSTIHVEANTFRGLHRHTPPLLQRYYVTLPITGALHFIVHLHRRPIPLFLSLSAYLLPPSFLFPPPLPRHALGLPARGASTRRSRAETRRTMDPAKAASKGDGTAAGGGGCGGSKEQGRLCRAEEPRAR